MKPAQPRVTPLATSSGRAQAGQAEMRGEARTNVGEALAPPEHAARDAGAEGEDRHILACVVTARPGRVIAMVGGDDAGIAGAERG